MRTSSDAIVTTHAGSLPRPDELIELNHRRLTGEFTDEEAFQRTLTESVADLVRRQRDIGIAMPGDGEYGKAMGQKLDYGAWWTYSFQRLAGLEIRDLTLFETPPHESGPGNIVLTSFGHRRDRTRFAEAYADRTSGASVGGGPRRFPACVAPLTYRGQDAIAADIANFTAALRAAGVEEGFMTAVAPGSCARVLNEYYADEDEFLFACADAMREEYKAIIDAGLILQLDDPCIAENWDQITPEPSVADYQAFTMKRVEALNHAISGLPQDRIRFHLCWGSWHGPHTTDIPMRDIVEVMLKINAGAYVFEAGNVRHEHEWRVWQDVKLPDGKVIVPGVVSHATNVVEHPELVADRIERFADGVGRERVLAGTDCGLGGRIHPQIAWAKLESLVQGAELATNRLWHRSATTIG
ncbi:MAG TPA: cobalamin-independent methionine synthase II family protein [Pseudonocardiaceae bacterium]|jgi:5-methyltetrahydropteroyltriglutamate--homocysteine methyltransferase|nr:cobalamin-independent methionine synthase II family protein [Pseudonocardiaceae bacterium]